MKALDTNVIVRLIVGDDQRQQATAQALLSSPLLITTTVLIETGWVLGSRYGFSRNDIVAALETLFDHEMVAIADDARVRWALGRYASGGDLADLLHIAACGDMVTFITFDRGVAPAAGAESPVPIETLA